MFTVHELDRDGNPHRELLSTQYIDIAEHAVRGLIRDRFPEESRTTQDLVASGTNIFMICVDGLPYRRLVLREETIKRWRFEDQRHIGDSNTEEGNP